MITKNEIGFLQNLLTGNVNIENLPVANHILFEECKFRYEHEIPIGDLLNNCVEIFAKSFIWNLSIINDKTKDVNVYTFNDLEKLHAFLEMQVNENIDYRKFTYNCISNTVVEKNQLYKKFIGTDKFAIVTKLVSTNQTMLFEDLEMKLRIFDNSGLDFTLKAKSKMELKHHLLMWFWETSENYEVSQMAELYLKPFHEVINFIKKEKRVKIL